MLWSRSQRHPHPNAERPRPPAEAACSTAISIITQAPDNPRSSRSQHVQTICFCVWRIIRPSPLGTAGPWDLMLGRRWGKRWPFRTVQGMQNVACMSVNGACISIWIHALHTSIAYIHIWLETGKQTNPRVTPEALMKFARRLPWMSFRALYHPTCRNDFRQAPQD